MLRSVELFVGAGGLGLGVSRAGFKPVLVADWDHDSCETIRENKRRRVAHVKHWPLIETDVRTLDYSDVPEGVELLAGGPPCQPFSICGKHQGYRDDRDMFPEVARAVRTIKPRAILIENVRGLTRPKFARYFSYITLQLTYPEIVRKDAEKWEEHCARLERYHTRGRPDGLHYRIVWRVINAADYGVPQHRWRVVIVGFRSDLNLEWSFPLPTHSRDALIFDQWATGTYWERHGITKRRRPEAPAPILGRADRLRSALFPLGNPWATVRDAMATLPEPSKSDEPPIANHRFMPGARTYTGHTGSPYDWPAKTLKAGDHGVPGGENMLVTDNGGVRYFSVREAARLQTFPDEYTFPMSWTESMRQIGNAVPVTLAQLVAESVRLRLDQ
jgi:DNA (cytosine-5)-methyltransferase 1